MREEERFGMVESNMNAEEVDTEDSTPPAFIQAESDQSLDPEIQMNKDRRNLFLSRLRLGTIFSLNIASITLLVASLERHQNLEKETTRLAGRQEELVRMFGPHAPSFSRNYHERGMTLLRRHRWGLSHTIEGLEKEKESEATIYPETEKIDPLPFLASSDENSSDLLEKTIDSSEVRHYLEILPAGFVRGEISAIHFSDDQPVIDRYGIKDMRPLAWCEGGVGSPAEITFFRGSRGLLLHEVTGTIVHELAHANDWRTDNEMSEDERMDLLIRVGHRVEHPGRYRSAYVESIADSDPNAQRYSKAIEYWAEIVERYFQAPELLPLSDYLIVDQFIKKIDPSFDPNTFLEKNIKLYRSIHRSQDSSRASAGKKK